MNQPIPKGFMTYEVLYERLGENSDTAPDPIALWEGQVDLATTKGYCLYYDDDRLVQCQQYEVLEVLLPEWLPVEEWISDRVSWKYTWGMGVDPSWPESWQRCLVRLTGEERLAASALLRTKSFGSSYRAGLRVQLVGWFLQPEDTRSPGPFMARDWDSLVTQWICQEAKQISDRLYRYGRGSGVNGANRGAPLPTPVRPKATRTSARKNPTYASRGPV